MITVGSITRGAAVERFPFLAEHYPGGVRRFVTLLIAIRSLCSGFIPMGDCMMLAVVTATTSPKAGSTFWRTSQIIVDSSEDESFGRTAINSLSSIVGLRHSRSLECRSSSSFSIWSKCRFPSTMRHSSSVTMPIFTARLRTCGSGEEGSEHVKFLRCWHPTFHWLPSPFC